MSQQIDATIQCLYCREYSPAGEQECPWCGAPLQSVLQFQETGGAEEHTLEEIVEKSNEELMKSGARAAELAFGVGCTLGVIASVILIAIIFIAITRTWTILAVITLILALTSFLVSTYLSTRAREATTRATYERGIRPEIDQFTTTNEISRKEFYVKAAEILPKNSPLLSYLAEQEI